MPQETPCPGHSDLSECPVFFSLSPRESEILALKAGGLTRLEIALELVISESTVKTHLYNASRRLRARDGTHAVALAIVWGLIDIDSLLQHGRAVCECGGAESSRRETVGNFDDSQPGANHQSK